MKKLFGSAILIFVISSAALADNFVKEDRSDTLNPDSINISEFQLQNVLKYSVNNSGQITDCSADYDKSTRSTKWDSYTSTVNPIVCGTIQLPKDEQQFSEICLYQTEAGCIHYKK